MLKTMLKKVLKSLLRISIAVVIGFSTLCMGLVFFADRIVFQPPVRTDTAQKYTFLPVGNGETIAAMVLDPPFDGAYTVLFFHGNAEDLSSTGSFLYEYHNRGYGAASCDYEGYGESGGTPSEAAVYRAADAMWDYLTRVKHIPPEKIIVASFSVGGGAACYVAQKYKACALVLEAPFASAFQAVLPVSFIPGDLLRNDRRISSVKCPVLIFHGENDNVVPLRNAKKLYSLANEPKKLIVVKGASHNDLRSAAGELYFTELEKITGK